MYYLFVILNWQEMSPSLMARGVDQSWHRVRVRLSSQLQAQPEQY